jgi:hypothetical protein
LASVFFNVDPTLSQKSHLPGLADFEADSFGASVGRLQKKKARAKLYKDKS